MSTLQEATQVIDLFRSIATIARIELAEQDDLNEALAVIQALGEVGINVCQAGALPAQNQLETSMNTGLEGGTETGLSQADVHAGYEAARVWYADLDERLARAKGYFAPSLLQEAFLSLSPKDQGNFLDAVGTLVVSSKVSGEPCPQGFDFIGSIALDAMTPEQQDKVADDQEKSREAGNA